MLPFNHRYHANKSWVVVRLHHCFNVIQRFVNFNAQQYQINVIF